MLGYFKGNHQSLLIVIPLLTFFLWLPGIIEPSTENLQLDLNASFLFSPIHSFQISYPIQGKFIAFILVIALGFLLSRLNITYYFIPNRTQLHTLFFVFLGSTYTTLQGITPTLLVTFLFIWVVFKLFGTFKKDQLCYEYFDIGLIIAVGSMIYVPFIFIVLFIWISMSTLRPFRLREWLFTLLGLMIPYFLLFTYYFFKGNSITVFLSHQIHFFTEKGIPFPFTSAYYPLYIIAGIYFIIGSFQMLRTFGIRKLHARKYFGIWLILFIMLVLMYLVIPSAGIELLFIILIPVSFLFSNYFITTKTNTINNIFFILLILSLAFLRYMDIK